MERLASDSFLMLSRLVTDIGRFIATGGEDCHVKIFRLHDGEDGDETSALVACAVGHSGVIHHVAWSPDERQVISVGDDACICIWNFFQDE